MQVGIDGPTVRISPQPAESEGVVIATASAEGLSDAEFTAEAIRRARTPNGYPVGFDGRFTVVATGRPIILNGDVACNTIVQLDSAEVQTYLDARGAVGRTYYTIPSKGSSVRRRSLPTGLTTFP